MVLFNQPELVGMYGFFQRGLFSSFQLLKFHLNEEIKGKLGRLNVYMNSPALPGTTESIAFLMMGKFILGGYNGKFMLFIIIIIIIIEVGLVGACSIII